MRLRAVQEKNEFTDYNYSLFWRLVPCARSAPFLSCLCLNWLIHLGWSCPPGKPSLDPMRATSSASWRYSRGSLGSAALVRPLPSLSGCPLDSWYQPLGGSGSFAVPRAALSHRSLASAPDWGKSLDLPITSIMVDGPWL